MRAYGHSLYGVLLPLTHLVYRGKNKAHHQTMGERSRLFVMEVWGPLSWVRNKETQFFLL